jgi:hypothetical protein
VTLGERLFNAAVATGAHPFAEAGAKWSLCSEAQRARWEACGVMVDAATRADVVGQLYQISARWPYKDRAAVSAAADRVEAGRS